MIDMSANRSLRTFSSVSNVRAVCQKQKLFNGPAKSYVIHRRYSLNPQCINNCSQSGGHIAMRIIDE